MTQIYNRYFSSESDISSVRADLTNAVVEPAPTNANAIQFEDVSSEEPHKEQTRSGGLRGLFGDNFKLPELDADTILLLVLVYFLVSDGDSDHISDTLLIIGMLLLLGF